jgi:harmonin
VQFTKENGIAKEAGMQPGDQIVSCNGIDFSNILFSEAVTIMKATSVLELYIRPGAGLDLFPSESSGYNSSASSVTGDQSPCWGEQTKRLSIVREESTNSSDRMNGGGGGAYGKMRFNRCDKPLYVDVPKVPENYSKNSNNNYGELKSTAAAAATTTPNTTIINLTENGTLINNTILPGLNNGYAVTKDSVGGDVDPTNKKIADICFVSRQNETKIVTVEVHRSSNTSSTSSGNFPSLNGGEKDERDSIGSNTSSLSSAISDELKRRAEVSERTREEN